MTEPGDTVSGAGSTTAAANRTRPGTTRPATVTDPGRSGSGTGIVGVVNEPVHPEDVRISDADRQAVADRLRAAHGEGYLDLSEFDARVAEVWRMRTRASNSDRSR